jgi:hypothetical protein
MAATLPVEQNQSSIHIHFSAEAHMKMQS